MPTNQSFIPLVRLPGYDVLLVQELIDADNASWNMDKLEENFEPIMWCLYALFQLGNFLRTSGHGNMRKVENLR
jgi:hypothetical protein